MKNSNITTNSSKYIHILGAREHNLKNISLDLPREKLIVITGLSGSGKSSLAFDTIYAEGQRRYIESLSTYARQFLEIMKKPDVDQIEGLSPAISIEQKTTSRNPRSTVGTITEIYDYLRLLFARIGIAYSPMTGLPIESQTVTQIVDRIMRLPDMTRIYILSPIIRGRKGEFRKEFSDFQKKGFHRVKIDGQFYEISERPVLDKNIKHEIDIVIDRLVIKSDLGNRLADSLEIALQLTDGIVAVEIMDIPNERLIFSSRFACPHSDFTIDEIEPRLFSFNSPYGACTFCNGLGTKSFIDAHSIIPDPTLPIGKNAIVPWSKSGKLTPYYHQTLLSLANHFNFSLSSKWQDLDKSIHHILLYGSGVIKINFAYQGTLKKFRQYKPFEGIIPNLNRRYHDNDINIREDISAYQTSSICKMCHGFRLRPEALAIKIAHLHIGEVTDMPIHTACEWLISLDKHLNQQQQDIAKRIIKEIQERLNFLNNVGLSYLSLSRSARTLSGGESQRIRLASQIGSALTGVLYVLDEPSIGLHQRDNTRLLETLTKLRDLGNTVIVVEHDKDAILAADHIIDIGPFAGIHGGEITFQGTVNEIMKSKTSLTGEYLSGKRKILIPSKRRKINKKHVIRVIGASGHNLKNISVNIPLGVLVCITGVSGSGKSTFLLNTLYAAIAHQHPEPHEAIEGLHLIDKVINISQSAIGRTPRSNPATYTGIFTFIREWFSHLPESRVRGYKAGRFSFNVKGGRCETCQGDGTIKIEMHFLPDVYVKCDACHGSRYNRETLEIKFKDKTIADILEMTVDDGVFFFQSMPLIYNKIIMLQRVGLGYIKIGQHGHTLSGGESQRVKLAKELSKRMTGQTLYILDEPTTGLHFHDVSNLLDVLHTLVDAGNTVVIIEHNLDVIKTADWVIDLGPEGGEAGGEIVAIGTPEDISHTHNSYTGQYLKKIL